MPRDNCWRMLVWYTSTEGPLVGSSTKMFAQCIKEELVCWLVQRVWAILLNSDLIVKLVKAQWAGFVIILRDWWDEALHSTFIDWDGHRMDLCHLNRALPFKWTSTIKIGLTIEMDFVIKMDFCHWNGLCHKNGLLPLNWTFSIKMDFCYWNGLP